MKFTLFILLSLFSSLTFAGEKYICREIDGDENSPMKLMLTQVGNEKLREGRIYGFKLEIFKGYTATAFVSESVNVKTEDVLVHFTNTAQKISGIIYLDELDQTHVKIGKTEYRFDCR